MSVLLFHWSAPGIAAQARECETPAKRHRSSFRPVPQRGDQFLRLSVYISPSVIIVDFLTHRQARHCGLTRDFGVDLDHAWPSESVSLSPRRPFCVTNYFELNCPLSANCRHSNGNPEGVQWPTNRVGYRHTYRVMAILVGNQPMRSNFTQKSISGTPSIIFATISEKSGLK